MHFISPDLNLKRLTFGSDQSCMKRLIHIEFRHGDIIFKTPGDRFIHLMNHPQSGITVLYRLHQNSDRKQIIDLIQCLFLFDHLFIDAEEMLDPSFYIRLDTGIFHMLFYFRHNRLYIFFTNTFFIGYLRYQIIIYFRFQILQSQIIQFDLHLGNPQTLSNRRIDVHSFSGFLPLFLRPHVFQSSHIVQTVRQFNQNHTDVLRHGKKHLS